MRDQRDAWDRRDARNQRPSAGFRAGSDLPGGDFLPGFEQSDGDWGHDDRRAGRRGRAGAPARDDRFPDDGYRQERFSEERFQQDRYPGEHGRAVPNDPGRYERDRYDEDRYGQDRYDQDQYRDDLGAFDDGQGRRRKRGARRLAPWIALLVVLALVTPVGYYGWHYYKVLQAKDHPPDYVGAGAGPQVVVQVMSGDTATSLGVRLVSDGVVESQRAFILAAERSTSTAGLEAGYFQMNVHMQASLAYAYLINPKHAVRSAVTIPEGKRVAQIIATLAAQMHLPVSQFENIVNNPSQLGLPSYATKVVPGFNGIGYKAEGYLFPATYVIQPHETALQVLQAMVTKYNQESAVNNLPAAAAASHLTVQQLLIEASLVQAEAGSASDMPKIAEVISNRLKAGMALQFDSVLEYGLDKFAINIQRSWSSIPGPYNDFLLKGLPPGPICNPGLAAITAVLHPASGNWLYFLAYPNGKSQFSATPLPGQT